MVLVVKNMPAKAEDIRGAVSISGWGRSPGGGHDNLLEYSCLENLMGIETWWGTVHGVPKSGHDRLSMHVWPVNSVVIVSAKQQR